MSEKTGNTESAAFDFKSRKVYEKFSEHLLCVRVLTEKLSEQDLLSLNQSGHIPTGIMNFILACRAPINNTSRRVSK